jgi:hypothetical protein
LSAAKDLAEDDAGAVGKGWAVLKRPLKSRAHFRARHRSFASLKDDERLVVGEAR